jgi:coproporphyrinogen III oxidase-like Fe-S oxidoreductase
MTTPLLGGSLYRGYQYAYPHKTAYGPLHPPVELRGLWAEEDKRALFLYIHIPFCEMRCGFCNLLSVTGADEQVDAYLDALERQASTTSDYLEDFQIARLAVGGGTPTILQPRQLERALTIAASLGAKPASLPASVEVSPRTAEPDRLAVLQAHGVDRISIGVESFSDEETKALGRPQRWRNVERALSAIRTLDFPVLNIDLIYGMDGQTPANFLESVEAALEWEPEELYLYPLYVRPMTGLGKRTRSALDHPSWDAARLACYRAGRDRLREAGYRQFSMRMFRRQTVRNWGPPYRCQEDGMIGLGAGARSYTRSLHYSTRYAVSRAGILDILNRYIACGEADFSRATHGVHLSEDERRRRFALMSLLTADGLDLARYAARFGGCALEHLPQLRDLEPLGLASTGEGVMRLTEAGLECSDAIGPRLQSTAMRERMESYQCR